MTRTLAASAVVVVLASCGGSDPVASEPPLPSTDAINGFIDDDGVGDFDHIVDDTGATWANFQIVSQPSFIFLDADGDSTSHLGPLGGDGLTERLDTLTGN